MGREKKATVKTYGRHRQRVISCDVWNKALEAEKKQVFSTSSSSDCASANSTHNDSSHVFLSSRVTRAKGQEKNKENDGILTRAATRACERKKYYSSDGKDSWSSTGSDSLFSSHPRRQPLKSRNTNAPKNYGKRKHNASLEYSMFKNKKINSVAEDNSSIGSKYNFSEFDDYSLMISGSPVQEGDNVGMNPRRQTIETSTPCSKRRQVSTPLSVKIQSGNISYIKPIDDSPRETSPKSVKESQNTPTSCGPDLDRLGLSSIIIGSPVTEDLDLMSMQDQNGTCSSNSTSESYKSPLGNCAVQLEKISQSLISLHITQTRGKNTSSDPLNFTDSCSLFSTETSEEDECSDEGDEDDDEESYEYEEVSVDHLSDIDEDEEEIPDQGSEVFEESDPETRKLSDHNNSTLFMLADTSYLKSSTEKDELSVISSCSTELSYHTADGDNGRKDLNESVFDIITPSKRKSKVSDISPRSKVLQVCQQEDVTTFDAVFPDRMMSTCKKVGEGVYGEVFRTQNNGKWVAIKIIPIEGSFDVNDEPQKLFEEILPEIVISRELSSLIACKDCFTSNFCQVDSLMFSDDGQEKDWCAQCQDIVTKWDVVFCVCIIAFKVSCVQGEYPEMLLRQWDIFKKSKYSENDRPDMFDEEQLFIVFEFADGGTDVESCQLNNIQEAKSVLTQVAFSLAVAEEKLEFEHRDLHWGNVLVKRTNQKHITYKLLGRTFNVDSHNVHTCIIDFTLSRLKKDGCTVYNNLATDETLFEGTGDIQFDVYREMKELNGNNWEPFHPYTNVLWLHYLANKLVRSKRYTQNTRADQGVLRKFRSFLKDMLEYESACELVTNDDFFRS